MEARNQVGIGLSRLHRLAEGSLKVQKYRLRILLPLINWPSLVTHRIKTEQKSVPEFIDPVFAKTSPKRSFSVIENERLGVFSRKLGL
jgi:hypothetical protein